MRPTWLWLLSISIFVLLFSQLGVLSASARANVQLVHSLEKLVTRSLIEPLLCIGQVDSDDASEYQIPVHSTRAGAFHAALSGDCQRAAELWTAVVTRQPGDRISWLWLGDVYLAMGESRQAQAAWRQARADAILAARGRKAEAVGDLVNAERWLVQAAEIEDSPRATGDLVKLYVRLGRKSEAEHLLQAWVQRVDERQTAYWLTVGMLAELNERWAEAVTAYQRGLALEPYDYALLVQAKIALEKCSDWAGAIAVTQRLLELQRGSLWWMLELGRYEGIRGNYTEAIAWVRKAQEYEPAYIPPYYLARIACDKGDLDSAMAYFEEGLRLAPDNWTLLYQQGMCIYFLSHDIATARAYLERAADQDRGQPGIEDLYFKLAEWYVDSGEIERAIAALGRVLALEPGNVIAQQRLNALQTHRK